MYKVGDEVYIKSYSTLKKDGVIKEDWVLHTPLVTSSGLLINDKMLMHLSRKATITKVVGDGHHTRYTLDICEGWFYWSEDLLTTTKQKRDMFQYLITKYKKLDLEISNMYADIFMGIINEEYPNEGEGEFRAKYISLIEQLKAIEVLIENL